MLRVGCNSSRISSMSAIEWRGKRLLLVGACRPILQILTLFHTKKVSLCKILGVLADNLYYDGALVHEPILFLKPLIVFKPNGLPSTRNQWNCSFAFKNIRVDRAWVDKCKSWAFPDRDTRQLVPTRVHQSYLLEPNFLSLSQFGILHSVHTLNPECLPNFALIKSRILDFN